MIIGQRESRERLRSRIDPAKVARPPLHGPSLCDQCWPLLRAGTEAIGTSGWKASAEGLTEEGGRIERIGRARHHTPPQTVGRSAPLAPRADHSRRLPWRPSLPAPVLPRLATRREMGTPETPSRVYTWGGVIDINGVTRSHHQEKRSDGVPTRQKPHGTCTRGMDSSTIEPASRAQLPETPSCVYTR